MCFDHAGLIASINDHVPYKHVTPQLLRAITGIFMGFDQVL